VSPAPIPAFGTTFQNPILLAAGTAGFGRELVGTVALDALGGLVTKSVSPEPRQGNPPPRVAEFPGGMLNSIGLANPGVEGVLRVELPWLRGHLKQARVVVSVVGDTIDAYAAVVTCLTDDPSITAFEVNLSCPNTERGGEFFGADDGVLHDLVTRCRAVSRRPIIAKLAPTLSDVARTARVAQEAGADGLAVVNTIPGTRLRRHGGRCVDSLGAGHGGVSGPLLLPVGVLATRRVHDATGLPVIGVGGVRSLRDVEEYLSAGASLVGIGTAALADPRLPERLAREWSRG
jgi:dihydroorotate dehydrogenase (NAD+) catalytic subunit